jgi:hypothetical protein
MSAKAFVFARFLADFGEVTASPCCVSPANSKAVGTLFLLGIMRVASNGIGRNSRRFLCETAVGSGTASTPNSGGPSAADLVRQRATRFARADAALP